MSNSTGCPVEEYQRDPQPLFSNGEIHFKAHDVGWIVSGFFAIITTITSLWIILKHLQFYTVPNQQRYIVRILFMPPIYAIVSFCSYYWWTEALYFQLIRDCYEAIVIGSFFYLLLSYLSTPSNSLSQPPRAPSPSPSTSSYSTILPAASTSSQASKRQKDKVVYIPLPPPPTKASKRERAALLREVFLDVEVDHWIWPLGYVKWRPQNGLRYLMILKWGILQYVVIRPVGTVIAVVSQYFNLYCLSSWSPTYTHLWVTTIISISVSVAMYLVLQLYVDLKKQLANFQPLLKFFAVKAVVFLTFWQESALSVLALMGWIKHSQYWTADQIVIGLSAILVTVEMTVISFLHIRAFSYIPYRPVMPTSQARALLRTKKSKALGHALDFRDVFREIGAGWDYMWMTMKGGDPDLDRRDDWDEVMGKRNSRKVVMREKRDEEKEDWDAEEEEDFHEHLKRVRMSKMGEPKESDGFLWEINEAGTGRRMYNEDGTLSEFFRKKKHSTFESTRDPVNGDERSALLSEGFGAPLSLTHIPPLYDDSDMLSKYIRENSTPRPPTQTAITTSGAPRIIPTNLKMPTPLSPSRFPDPRALEYASKTVSDGSSESRIAKKSTLELVDTTVAKSPLSSYNRGPMIESLDLQGLDKKHKKQNARRMRRSSDPFSEMPFSMEGERRRSGVERTINLSSRRSIGLPSNRQFTSPPCSNRANPIVDPTSMTSTPHNSEQKQFLTSPSQFSSTSARYIPPPESTYQSYSSYQRQLHQVPRWDAGYTNRSRDARPPPISTQGEEFVVLRKERVQRHMSNQGLPISMVESNSGLDQRYTRILPPTNSYKGELSRGFASTSHSQRYQPPLYKGHHSRSSRDFASSANLDGFSSRRQEQHNHYSPSPISPTSPSNISQHLPPSSILSQPFQNGNAWTSKYTTSPSNFGGYDGDRQNGRRNSGFQHEKY